jgi:hypothetical protein
MTRNKKGKAEARALQAATGMPYVRARRTTRESGDGNSVTDFRLPSRMQLLEPYLQGACELRLLDEPVASWPAVEFTGLPALHEPTIQSVELDLSTAYVDVVDEYEGGSELCTVTALGSLVVDGQMAKGDAIMSAASGEVEIVDPDFNRHYALVLAAASVPVQVEFSAFITRDVESVEDVSLSGLSSA